MSDYSDDLLLASSTLQARRSGQKGPLKAAYVRRSISTTYYAIFHFLLDEATGRIIGAHHDLRQRRRIFARTLTHDGLSRALNKVRGATIDPSVEDLFRLPSTPAGPVGSPPFVREIARTFLDARAKREDADYDLNASLSEADARLLHRRVGLALAGWAAATSPADRDVKHALCVLLSLKGQLRG